MRYVGGCCSTYNWILHKDQFPSSLGRTWLDRTEAARTFARWLGFTRTGGTITDTVRSLINGLLRERRLEAPKGRVSKL